MEFSNGVLSTETYIVHYPAMRTRVDLLPLNTPTYDYNYSVFLGEKVSNNEIMGGCLDF